MNIRKKLDQIFYPSPDFNKSGKFGYEPHWLIKLLRSLARCIVAVFRLNSNNRLMVEIQQMLDPSIKIKLPNDESLMFRTGHGRLVWRAKTLLTEEEGLIKWINSFNSEDIFFDVGANMGGYALYAAKTKGIKVYAFEPEINNIQLLYENIYKNKLNHLCVPIPLACDRQTAMKPFYITGFSKGKAMSTIGRKPIFVLVDNETFVLDALCIRIDDFISNFEIPYPTKVKIDVDGNELSVIEGMDKTLNHVREIYIEFYAQLDEYKKIESVLKRRGFVVDQIYKAKTPLQHEELANYLFIKA
ncbi:FkbM family methyltransferase [Candidatus Omnitrophota bacterium]